MIDLLSSIRLKRIGRTHIIVLYRAIQEGSGLRRGVQNGSGGAEVWTSGGYAPGPGAVCVSVGEA